MKLTPSERPLQGFRSSSVPLSIMLTLSSYLTDSLVHCKQSLAYTQSLDITFFAEFTVSSKHLFIYLLNKEVRYERRLEVEGGCFPEGYTGDIGDVGLLSGYMTD